MIYLLIILTLLVMSYRYDIANAGKGRLVCYYSMLIVFILIAGLRYRLGVDTPAYIDSFYHVYPTLDNFSFEDYPIGKDPLYVLLNSVVLSLGGRFYIVQLIQSAFVNILIFRYIRKHSSYIFTCLFFYALLCYTNYNMEIMRGSMSIAICLFANDYVLERKWLKAFLLFFIALLFHVQTILMFIIPLVSFLRFDFKGIVVLILSYFVGYIVQISLGDYFELLNFNESFANKAVGYANSEIYGAQKGNLNFYIVNILPNIIISFLSLYALKRHNTKCDILILEPFVMIGLLFIFVQIAFQAAYRYVDYYKIYFVILYAEFFALLLRNTIISRGVAYLRTIIVFLPIFLIPIHFYLSVSKYRYVPYSSIFDKEINKKREMLYNSLRDDLPRESINEY